MSEKFMLEALEVSKQALLHCEPNPPVGCVLVKNGQIVSKGFTQAIGGSHAEVEALNAHSGELSGITAYVTLEPCVMCAGAIVQARVRRLVFGAADPKAGACGSLYTIPSDRRLNHVVDMTTGVLEQEAGAMLQDFFKKQRAQGKK